MKKIIHILGIVMGIFFLAVVGFLISIPIVNNSIARQTAQNIKKIDLPNYTEYRETFSKAGKLTGNGNGMQYAGGILIKSDLSLPELQSYYAQYENNGSSCIVEKQTGQNIPFIEHGTVSLRTDIDSDTYYIVYSWGNSHFAFSDLDLRGH